MHTLTRRRMLRTLTTTPMLAAVAGAVAARAVRAQTVPEPPFGAGTLPAGVRSRLVTGVNGITMHVLEAGHETAGRPGLLLVHGFEGAHLLDGAGHWVQQEQPARVAELVLQFVRGNRA